MFWIKCVAEKKEGFKIGLKSIFIFQYGFLDFERGCTFTNNFYPGSFLGPGIRFSFSDFFLLLGGFGSIYGYIL